MAKKTSGKRRIWPKVLGGLALLIILTVIILPRLLVGQATQKPAEAVTFVTQQQSTGTLQDKMQQSLANGGSNNQGNNSTAPQGQNGNGSNVTVDQQMSAGQNSTPNNQQSGNTGTNVSNGQYSQPGSQTNTQTSSQGTPESVPQNNTTADTNSTPVTPAAGNNKFSVHLGENEISSMIYSGLNERTAPEYRQSIQGVSTRISGGRATITVALLPRYLPDAFLNNLPGVTRDTPTVYVGGELGLHRDGDSVSPDIYQLSLGNFHVPMPFIREAIAATVQQQAAQMLHLPNGQQGRLDNVILDGGALTLEGHVD